jgi:hypothetical protein
MYEYGILKSFKVILRKRTVKRENNRRGESNWEYIVCIYGNATIKSPVQLLCASKNIYNF